MTVSIVKDTINWLDIGGVVQDFKDIGFCLFAPKEKKIQKYYEDINRVLAKPSALDKQDFICVADACFKRKSLMVDFFGNITGDKRKYIYCHALQSLSESMIRNFPPRPDHEAQFRESAANLPTLIE